NRSTEHGEIIRSDMNALHLLRMITASEIHPSSAKVIGCDLLEDARLLMPDIKLRNIRAWKASLWGDVHQLHQRLWIGICERFKQNIIDDREDCGVHADTN